jgi:hypothetical protein
VSFSCHHPSAALQKGRQWIPQTHFNGWWVMDSFMRPSAEMTERWMVRPNITKEEHCTALSGCSDSHARQVLQQKCIYAWPSHVSRYDGQWPILLHTSAG